MSPVSISYAAQEPYGARKLVMAPTGVERITGAGGSGVFVVEAGGEAFKGACVLVVANEVGDWVKVAITWVTGGSFRGVASHLHIR
jgi:hypothetical protein